MPLSDSGTWPRTDHGGGSFLDFPCQLDEAFEKLIYRRWAIPSPAEWRPRLDLHETPDGYVMDHRSRLEDRAGLSVGAEPVRP
jgi:hypothetical protein